MGASATRPTRDIDLLGYLPNQVESLVDIIREICRQEVEPDALLFDPATVIGIVIKEDADYEGIRVTFRGSLQNMPIPMQIDIGFGDIVFPAPVITEYHHQRQLHSKDTRFVGCGAMRGPGLMRIDPALQSSLKRIQKSLRTF